MICSTQREVLCQSQLIFYGILQHPNIPYAFKCPCVDIIFPSMCNNENFSTQYIKQIEFITQQISHWISLKIFFFLQCRLWSICHLFCNALIFFTVSILFGNNQKIGLKWKQNLMSCRRYEYGAEHLKILRHLKV